MPELIIDLNYGPDHLDEKDKSNYRANYNYHWCFQYITYDINK